MAVAVWAGAREWREPPAPAFASRDWIVVGDFNHYHADPRLPDTLGVALRVGLEQSPHVNLLSALAIQGALQRMGRDAQSRLDLVVGSEVALRQGARVLLLPSIDGIPGHPHIRLRLVDPATRRTLFVEEEHGEGADSALVALDAATRRVRARLGEPVAGIRASGKPMAQVTTTDIDALRSYAQAEALLHQSENRQALALYGKALARDPEFAMAQVGLARVHARNGDYTQALALAQAADRNRARLSHREALELDTFLARFGPPAQAMARFKVWSTLYPDAFRAHYGYALAALADNHYPQALEAVAPALTSRNPAQGNAWYLKGAILLALNRYQEAKAAFERADALGVRGAKLESAEVFAAGRDFDAAARSLRSQTAGGMAGSDLRLRLDDPLFLLDQGRWTEALATLSQLQADAAAVDRLQARALETTRLSLDAYAAKLTATRHRQFIAEAAGQLRGDDPVARDQAAFQLLAGGWVAARGGDAETARHALDLASGPAGAAGGTVLLGMRAILEAELALAAGRPETARDLLRARHDGTELYFSHSVLLRALEALGEHEAALAEADWLIRQRGRAYAEWNSFDAWNAANIVESHLARLSAAELAWALNRPAEARRHAEDFLRDWPGASRLPAVRTRLQPLQQLIAGTAHGS